MKYSGQIFDCNQLFERGLYYLYKNNKIVYIGKSETNVMQRVLTHYLDKEKDFDSYLIVLKPQINNKTLGDMEKKAIKKHLPKYNKIHNDLYNTTQEDYDIAKEIKDNCWHTFIEIKDKKYVMCSKCGYKQKVFSKKSGYNKTKIINFF